MFPVLEFGHGMYTAGEGPYDGVPALIIIQDGDGVVGSEKTRSSTDIDFDTIRTVFKFNSRESLEVLIEQLNLIRSHFQ